MIDNLAALVGNDIRYPDGRDYAAIFGASVSTGARSPKLWNAAFQAHGIDALMLAMDVNGDRLVPLLDALEADRHFLGGAVAVPYKERVAQWLGDRLSPECTTIGAVNCIYRRSDGQLAGCNTDGEGALRSLQRKVGDLAGQTVTLMGLGGAGKAVAAYVARALGDSSKLNITNRTESTASAYAARIQSSKVDWPVNADCLAETDILINCTSIGSNDSVNATPLAEIGSENVAATRRLLSNLKPGGVVFDIIYNPSPTLLLSLAAEAGLETLDGSGMNLEQAVLAFGYAIGSAADSPLTRRSMEQARMAA